MEPEAIFVSDDARLRDGVLDPTDEEVLRQAGGGKRGWHVMIVTAAEAMKLADASRGSLPRRPSRPPGPGLRELRPEDMEEMGAAAEATWKYFQEEAARLLKDDRAAFIRRLRVDQRYTWRKVARACAQAWGTDWSSNQLAGMALCEQAAKWFLEDYRQAPWN
jgi:hypothetical protein